MSERRIARILVVKPSSLGDIVQLFPALEMLRRAFSGAELDYLVHPAFAEALDYSPWRVANKILFERGRMGSVSGFVPEFRKLAAALRERKYDLVIDFQGLFRSAFFARWAAGRGIVAGFAAPRERMAAWFYSLRVPVRSEHAVKRNAELAAAVIGTDGAAPMLPVPEVPAGAALPKNVPERYLLLLPGARWRSKRFPAELFAETAKRILERFPALSPVVAGGADERDAAEELCARLSGAAVNICGETSLTELFEVVRHAAGVVCNDSGPMHVAALMRRPLCAFFGPTRPGATGPWGEPKLCRVFRNDAAGCLECMHRECRTGDGRCFDIDAGAAAEAMCAMLAVSREENGI